MSQLETELDSVQRLMINQNTQALDTVESQMYLR